MNVLFFVMKLKKKIIEKLSSYGYLIIYLFGSILLIYL